MFLELVCIAWVSTDSVDRYEPAKMITVHVGQCGIQISSSFWELLCLEHSVSPDGELTESDLGNTSIFFQELNYGKYMPRAIIIDAEPTVMDEIKNGPYRNLFGNENMICGTEDSANNFARGSFFAGSRIIKPFRRCLNKLAEQVEYLEGFLVINSMGGGTGAGMGALLLQQIYMDYPKISRIQMTLFPSPTMSNAIVEPYNATLHSHTTMDTCELSMLFDNEALYDLCKRLLFINNPNYSNINRLLSLMMSSSTACMRFANTLNSGLKEIHTNLIAYPRIHHALMRYAPLDHDSRTSYNNPTVEQITKQVLSKDYQSLRCDCSRGKFISIILNYRGTVAPNEISATIQKYRTSAGIKFVDWSPTGFKIGINNQNQSYVPDSLIGFSEKSVTLIACTTAMKNNWSNLGRKFDLLYSRKSFLHWFINEGMEESEFVESRTDLKLLSDDYQEIGLTDKEIIDELANNPNKKSS